MNTRYADAVTSADRHTIYKNGVKEIAFLNGISATFMAKPSEKDIGSSCHIHSSLVDAEGGKSVFVDGKARRPTSSATTSAGMRAHIRELALLRRARRSTPTSATRPRAGRRPRSPGAATTAPAASAIVGHGASRRVECRIPGADVNPYLGYAALLAAGLDGIEKGTDPGPELKGNAYAEAEAEPFPSTLREAVDLWENSEFARKTFGEGVWRHYLNYGQDRAAAVRRGRDRLRAPPHVRARLSRH